MGKLTYIDGATYVGQFQDNVRHGQGKFVSKDGAIQEGTWANDNFVNQ